MLEYVTNWTYNFVDVGCPRFPDVGHTLLEEIHPDISGHTVDGRGNRTESVNMHFYELNFGGDKCVFAFISFLYIEPPHKYFTSFLMESNNYLSSTINTMTTNNLVSQGASVSTSMPFP